MAKKKKEMREDFGDLDSNGDTGDLDFYADIAASTGGEIFKEGSRSKYFIDTGNLALNYICSGRFVHGGIPGGRITEVYGPEASAKSLVGYSCLGSCQRMGGISVYLDCERAGNAEFAEGCGHLDSSRLITFWPPTLEQVEKKVIAVVKKIREKKGNDVPILIVWDSIGVTMTDREWNEVGLPENPTKEQIKAAGGAERPGERAKIAGAVLRKLNPFLDENNATIYIINQLRSKIGVLFGDPDTTTGGGRALPYYASLRLALAARKHIKEKKKEIPIGVNLTIANKKNRSFTPFWKSTGIQLYFNGGINPVGGLLSVLLNAGRIEPSGKGVYKVMEPWADGKDYKFKANKERNDVPMDLLFECPKIVDAQDAEEVKNYLSPYLVAVNLTNSDDIEEEDFGAELMASDDEE